MTEGKQSGAVSEHRGRGSRSVPATVAKLLLHGFVVTGMFLGFLFVSGWLSLLWLVGTVSLIPAVVLVVGFSTTEGLVNRKLLEILWSRPKRSLPRDLFVRGPALMIISALITLLSSAVTHLTGSPPSPDVLTVIPLLALWATAASPFNGLAGFGMHYV